MNQHQWTLAVKSRAAKRRLLVGGVPLCDMCGVQAGSERHHVFTKYLTDGCDLADEYANYHVVVSCICRECHEDAHTHEGRDKLLRFFYWLHGYVEIKKQYLLINNSMVIGIPYPLPLPSKGGVWRKARPRLKTLGRLYLKA